MRTPRTRVVKPAVSGWWGGSRPLHKLGDAVKWKTEFGPFSVSEEPYHDTRFQKRSPSKNVKGIGIKSLLCKLSQHQGSKERETPSLFLPLAQSMDEQS